jgi:hypothetical protein
MTLANCLKRLGLAAAVVVLTTCAVPQFTALGTPRAGVIERLGTPTATYTLADGERLQYSSQPGGTTVYNFDFDPQGRLARIEQALDPALFSRIQVDRWTTQDVERMFGKPARIEKVWSFDGVVWTYRYTDFYWRWALYVHIDRQGVVRKVLTGEEEPRPGQYE